MEFYKQLIALARRGEMNEFGKLFERSGLLRRDMDDIISDLVEAEEAGNNILAQFFYCLIKARDTEVESGFWREAFSETSNPEMIQFIASIKQPLSIHELYLIHDVDLMERIGNMSKLDTSETYKDFKDNLDDLYPDIYDLSTEKRRRRILAKLYK